MMLRSTGLAARYQAFQASPSIASVVRILNDLLPRRRMAAVAARGGQLHAVARGE
jgi:hypothetical protein